MACDVITGDILSSRKGVNTPGVVNSRSFYLYNPDYAFGFNDSRKYDVLDMR